MNTTSPFSTVLHQALLQPTRGVVGVVDDLLAACREQGLRLDWQTGLCRVRCLSDNPEGAIDVPLRKSVFRALLARVAVLCNERCPNSVSPYGGEGELSAGPNPGTILRATFVNTPDEQWLELVPHGRGSAVNGVACG